MSVKYVLSASSTRRYVPQAHHRQACNSRMKRARVSLRCKHTYEDLQHTKIYCICYTKICCALSAWKALREDPLGSERGREACWALGPQTSLTGSLMQRRAEPLQGSAPQNVTSRCATAGYELTAGHVESRVCRKGANLQLPRTTTISAPVSSARSCVGVGLSGGCSGRSVGSDTLVTNSCSSAGDVSSPRQREASMPCSRIRTGCLCKFRQAASPATEPDGAQHFTVTKQWFVVWRRSKPFVQRAFRKQETDVPKRGVPAQR